MPSLTNAYNAKRTIIDVLEARSAEVGHPLNDVLVTYSWRHRVDAAARIWGGRVTWRQIEDDTMVGGGPPLRLDRAVVFLHVQTRMAPTPEGGVRDSDERLEELLNAIMGVFNDNPRLAGAKASIHPGNGESVYGEDEIGVTSTAVVQVEVKSYVS